MESDWARIHSTELVSKLHGQRQHSIEVQIRTSDVEKRGERCCRRSAWLVQTIEFHVVSRRFYAASVSQGALLGKSPKMTPPPKVKGAMDNNGPVLRRICGKEEVNVSVMRLANVL
ncbi:hypothetical protein QQ045_015226 [Rhodiola kirilowii]